MMHNTLKIISWVRLMLLMLITRLHVTTYHCIRVALAFVSTCINVYILQNLCLLSLWLVFVSTPFSTSTFTNEAFQWSYKSILTRFGSFCFQSKMFTHLFQITNTFLFQFTLSLGDQCANITITIGDWMGNIYFTIN